MDVDFILMDQHLETPRAPSGAGKLVLSRLKPGQSHIGAPGPSLKLVVQGEEYYEIDGRKVKVQAGQFLYVDRGEALLATNRCETIGMCLLLPPPIEPLHGGADGLDPVLGRALVLSTRTSNLGRALFAFATSIARDPQIGRRLAGPLVSEVARAVREPLDESRAAIAALGPAKLTTRRELYRRLERARDFLHSEDQRSVALGELASMAGLSQFHLARYFKLAFGKSPIAYHRELRLQRAAELIAAGGRTLAEVAEEAGYSDGAALSHAFRRQYGEAPQRWQQLARAS
jgi:AraC-like DNA-binding protein/quercetin dioxygenase-like cupin family protein